VLLFNTSLRDERRPSLAERAQLQIPIVRLESEGVRVAHQVFGADRVVTGERRREEQPSPQVF
jgi:hypothetical protein